MQNRNISDIIEQYLKEILANDQQIEIKRSEIAHRFDVVPSQINYVIKTRFNMKNGYLVFINYNSIKNFEGRRRA